MPQVSAILRQSRYSKGARWAPFMQFLAGTGE